MSQSTANNPLFLSEIRELVFSYFSVAPLDNDDYLHHLNTLPSPQKAQPERNYYHHIHRTQAEIDRHQISENKSRLLTLANCARVHSTWSRDVYKVLYSVVGSKSVTTRLLGMQSQPDNPFGRIGYIWPAFQSITIKRHDTHNSGANLSHLQHQQQPQSQPQDHLDHRSILVRHASFIRIVHIAPHQDLVSWLVEPSTYANNLTRVTAHDLTVEDHASFLKLIHHAAVEKGSLQELEFSGIRAPPLMLHQVALAIAGAPMLKLIKTNKIFRDDEVDPCAVEEEESNEKVEEGEQKEWVLPKLRFLDLGWVFIKDNETSTHRGNNFMAKFLMQCIALEEFSFKITNRIEAHAMAQALGLARHACGDLETQYQGQEQGQKSISDLIHRTGSPSTTTRKSKPKGLLRLTSLNIKADEHDVGDVDLARIYNALNGMPVFGIDNDNQSHQLYKAQQSQSAQPLVTPLSDISLQGRIELLTHQSFFSHLQTSLTILNLDFYGTNEASQTAGVQAVLLTCRFLKEFMVKNATIDGDRLVMSASYRDLYMDPTHPAQAIEGEWVCKGLEKLGLMRVYGFHGVNRLSDESLASAGVPWELRQDHDDDDGQLGQELTDGEDDGEGQVEETGDEEEEEEDGDEENDDNFSTESALSRNHFWLFYYRISLLTNLKVLRVHGCPPMGGHKLPSKQLQLHKKLNRQYAKEQKDTDKVKNSTEEPVAPVAKRLQNRVGFWGEHYGLGSELWSSLKNLIHLEIDRDEFNFKDLEQRWMIENWPDLRLLVINDAYNGRRLGLAPDDDEDERKDLALFKKARPDVKVYEFMAW